MLLTFCVWGVLLLTLCIAGVVLLSFCIAEVLLNCLMKTKLPAPFFIACVLDSYPSSIYIIVHDEWNLKDVSVFFISISESEPFRMSIGSNHLWSKFKMLLSIVNHFQQFPEAIWIWRKFVCFINSDISFTFYLIMWNIVIFDREMCFRSIDIPIDNRTLQKVIHCLGVPPLLWTIWPLTRFSCVPCARSSPH